MGRDAVKRPRPDSPEIPSPVKRKTAAPTTDGNKSAVQKLRLADDRSLKLDIRALFTVSSLIIFTSEPDRSWKDYEPGHKARVNET